jgi:protein TonB
MQIKKYSHKNLNKNRILYFQIGLCVVLVLLFISVEWKSYSKPYNPETVSSIPIEFDEVFVVKIPEDKPKPIEEKVKPKKQTNQFKKVPNNTDIPQDKLFIITEPEPDFTPEKVLGKLDNPIPEPVPDVSSGVVEYFPIFPGCERYEENEERKSCLQERLYKFIGKHFDEGLASELGLKGDQKIHTSFKVTNTGEVKFIYARAPHPKLIEEAERVINKIPKMTPGKQGDMPVSVIFGLPIRFKVNP